MNELLNLASFSGKRDVRINKLIGCTNYQKFYGIIQSPIHVSNELGFQYQVSWNPSIEYCIASNIRDLKFRESLQISIKVNFHFMITLDLNLCDSMLSHPFFSELVL